MNYTDLNLQEKAQGAQQATLQSLETKIDQLLEYQKSAHRWAVIKGVVNFILFMVLVVFPIVGLYFFFRSMASQVDFGKILSQYNQASQLLNQVNSAQGQLQNGAVQQLLQKLPGLKP
jgi:hypothetical protein